MGEESQEPGRTPATQPSPLWDRTRHLHVVERDSSPWRDWLLFRDYLRTHANAGERYAALKIQPAAVDRDDRVRYRSDKAPLIGELMDEARAWRDLT